MSNKIFSEMDKHYDRHNNGICAICGCTTWSRWKLICDACLNKAIQEFIEKVEPKEQEVNKNENNKSDDTK